MAEQNQDLPLVVSEILIEMHEMRGDIKQLQEVTVHLNRSVEKLQGEMREVKDAINDLSTTVSASIKTLTEETRSNTEMMIAAFREEGLYVRQLLQQHDARITKLENNQPNN